MRPWRGTAKSPLLLLLPFLWIATVARAQGAPPDTRAGVIEQEQAAKALTLHPYQPTAGERWGQKVQNFITGTGSTWHPFFQSAYSGGGFTLGAGYLQYVSAYNVVDMRGSYTVSNYQRYESEFVAPRLFHRRGMLSVLGGWREATQVGFYGIGNDTPLDARVNYSFRQPYLSGVLTVRPTRSVMFLRGGLEWSQWEQRPGEGAFPTIETQYTPASLAGLDATVDYIQTQAAAGIDSRPSPGYARRGTLLSVTGRDFADGDDRFGFQRADYEAIQHIPILREAWVISLHGLASTTDINDGQQVPFFMLPSLGGGSSLRGFSSWRFRDRNSLLMQAEWRIIVNRFMETAFFFDTGKVASRAADLDFQHLQQDFGFGFRLHGPFATPVRIDFAKSHEGFHFVFSSSAVF